MHVNDDARAVGTGDAVVIPSQAVQWIKNTGTDTLRFIALVSPPRDAAGDERL